MEFRTIVDVPKPKFQIEPHEAVLFVGSCFAENIGRRFQEEKFPAVINPYGTMYNPASVLHTLEKLPNLGDFKWVFLTLGTNHVYIEKATGEIVDNCQKRPAALFEEKELTVDECADYLQRSVELLRSNHPHVNIVLTVSPIRYRKYGYHESQLSKATLLLAAAKSQTSNLKSQISYFPAYEILMDELRDYRFYASDMLHPSEQAVDYLWERLVEAYFSPAARQWLTDWQPVKQALAHRPFQPDGEEYRAFMDKTMLKVEALREKYPTFAYQK